LAYLRERWEGGCHNAAQLWRDLRQRGFRGSYAAVSRLAQSWRPAPICRAHRRLTTPSTPARTAAGYSPRKTCWLLLATPADLTADEQAYLTRLLHLCPQIALGQALTSEFHALIRERDVPALYAWLHGVRQSGIAEFVGVANGIWRDRRAVEAALTHAESQGQVEGQVNRLKLIKRCGYGRAGLDLLRRRLLLASEGGDPEHQQCRRALKLTQLAGKK
jgi:transposase